jgi:O-antigen/teichoic acid export membrane protein
MEKIQYVKQSILHTLERLFKTDIRYVLRGGSWLAVSQFTLSGTTFLLSIAFANLLPRETYGVYKYVLSVVALLAMTTLSGMDTAVTRAVAQGNEHSIYDALRTKLRFGMIGSVLAIGLSLYYFLNGNAFLGAGFIIASIALPLWESFDIYASFLNGKGLFKEYAKYYSITQLISALIVFAALIWTQDIIAILAAYFITNTLIRVINFFLVTRAIPPNDKKDPEMITYGKRLSAINLIGTLLGQLDQILVFHYIGAAELAVYALAIAPVEHLKGLLKNVQALALPRFAARTKEDVRTNIFSKAMRLGILVGLITLAYIIIAPLFYKIFFPKYIDATIFSQIAALSLIGVCVGNFFNTFLESQAEEKKLLQSNLFGIINIIILFPLIAYFGLMGAVIGRLIGRFLSLLVAVIIVKKISSQTNT